MTLSNIIIFFIAWASLIVTYRKVAWFIFVYCVLYPSAGKFRTWAKFWTVVGALLFATVMVLQWFGVYYGLHFIGSH